MFAPHTIFYFFVLSLFESISSIRRSHIFATITLTLSLYLVSYVPWPEQFRVWVSENAIFAMYWIMLGILSSVGVGSGFHTFILYLAPHVLRVAGTAIRLNSVNFSAQILGYFSIPASYDVEALAQAIEPTYAPDAWKLIDNADGSGLANRDEVSIIGIYQKVAWPCFLWGLGTAIGELPPYFVARASSAAGKSLDEITMVLELKKQKILNEEEDKEEEEEDKDQSEKKKKKKKVNMNDSKSATFSRKRSRSNNVIVDSHAEAHSRLTFVQRMQVIVYDLIQRYGFAAVLVAASIPNPLFDLAGITCGHFQVPFVTFFSATMIGKSLIKVTLQALFLILAAKRGESFLKSLVGDDADAGIEKLLQQGLPTSSSASSESSSGSLIMFLKAAWRGFLGGMVVFFLMSIVSSVANEYYIRTVVVSNDEKKNPVLDKSVKNSVVNSYKGTTEKVKSSRRRSVVVVK